MKGEELLKCLGSVDDKYIEELFTDSINDIKHERRKPRWGLIAACLAVVIIGSFAVFGGRSIPDETLVNQKPEQVTPVAVKNSVIILDVNPSISLTLNKHGDVNSVSAENDDANALLNELELGGMDYETAVKTIVSVFREHEYITPQKNSLLITVVSPDEKGAERIREKAVNAVTEKADQEYEISVLSQIMKDDSEYADSAKEFGISTGRMWLVEKTNKMNNDLLVENLVTQSVHTLNQLYEYTGLPELVERVGTASGTAPKDCISKMGVSKLTAEELVGLVKEVSDFYDEWDSRGDADSAIISAYDSASSKTDDTEEICYIVEESLNLLTKAGKKLDSASAQSTDQSTANEPIVTAEDVTEVADFVISIVEYFD